MGLTPRQGWLKAQPSPARSASPIALCGLPPSRPGVGSSLQGSLEGCQEDLLREERSLLEPAWLPTCSQGSGGRLPGGRPPRSPGSPAGGAPSPSQPCSSQGSVQRGARAPACCRGLQATRSRSHTARNLLTEQAGRAPQQLCNQLWSLCQQPGELRSGRAAPSRGAAASASATCTNDPRRQGGGRETRPASGLKGGHPSPSSHGARG